jgi:hypothetical protein
MDIADFYFSLGISGAAWPFWASPYATLTLLWWIYLYAFAWVAGARSHISGVLANFVIIFAYFSKGIMFATSLHRMLLETPCEARIDRSSKGCS